MEYEYEELNEVNNYQNLYLEGYDLPVKYHNNIFATVNDNIEHAIYGICQDKLLTNFSGTREKYQSILEEYDNNYKEGKIKITPETLVLAYHYVENLLNDSYLLFDNILITYNDNANGLIVFKAACDKFKEESSRYTHIVGFLENYNKNHPEEEIKRK